MIKDFVTALQFLTIFTVAKRHRVSEADLARSMVYFPVVGFLLGVLLVYSNKAMEWIFPHTIANVWILIFSVLLTRALHIDGLGDTLDGLMGGVDKETSLRIMKDSSLGTAGVLGIVFSLLLRYFSLNNLFSEEKTAALLTAPLLGRWSQTVMVFRAYYARHEGMGRAFVRHMRLGGMAVATLIAVGLSLFVNEARALFIIPAVAVFALISRAYIIKRLGGVTGDTIGAVSELSEVIVLLGFVVLSSGG